jgi:hypothetical protein
MASGILFILIAPLFVLACLLFVEIGARLLRAIDDRRSRRDGSRRQQAL